MRGHRSGRVIGLGEGVPMFEALNCLNGEEALVGFHKVDWLVVVDNFVIEEVIT